jgi:putative FmdB family regulatory protein
MPIYEYQCLDQGHRFEVLQKMSEDPISVCQECGGKVRKLISAAGFMLKGSGWYKDGYSSSKPPVTPSENSSSSAESKSAEPKKTETVSTTPTTKESKS